MIQLRFKNGAEKHLRAADVLWIHKVEIHKVEGTWLPGTGMHTCTHHIRVPISNRVYTVCACMHARTR